MFYFKTQKNASIITRCFLYKTSPKRYYHFIYTIESVLHNYQASVTRGGSTAEIIIYKHLSPKYNLPSVFQCKARVVCFVPSSFLPTTANCWEKNYIFMMVCDIKTGCG